MSGEVRPLRPLCPSCGGFKASCDCDPLREAYETGTDREWQLALRDYLAEAIMVRAGEVVTTDVAADRASNIAAVLSALGRGAR